MEIHVNLGEHSYDIVLERGILSRVGKELLLDRKVLIVTDSGVPEAYPRQVAAVCRQPQVVTVPAGEQSKTLSTMETLCRAMMENQFGRGDCVVAVGGGMVGDLAGFAAASYMRGVDFCNIPTTLLSQVDSSIGGKTAVNLDSVKNIVGAFYQPKKVLIDPEVLSTLTPRLFAEGLAEVIKMAATDDAQLFSLLEKTDPASCIEEIIAGALNIKRRYVEQDEKESGERMVLNFGHTVGHAIETCGGRYHGECVALGMLYMSDGDTRERIRALLEKTGLPTHVSENPEKLFAALSHDKKAGNGTVRVVRVDSIGTHRLETLPLSALRNIVNQII